MAPNDRHLILPRLGRSLSFAPVGKPIESPVPERVSNRPRHARALISDLQKAADSSAPKLGEQKRWLPADQRGLLLRFRARTGSGFDLGFFRHTSHKIELLSSRGGGSRQVVRAFVPEKMLERLETSIEKYGSWKNNDSRKPNFSDFFEQLGGISEGAITRLWNPPNHEPIPRGEVVLWEVWLRPAVVAQVAEAAPSFRIELGSHRTSFPGVVIVRMRGTFSNLKELLSATASVIEFRPASEVKVPPTRMTPPERAALARNFAGRIIAAPANSPVTTILDTGVRHQNVMLTASLPGSRSHSVSPAWQKDDSDGHGTNMAGAALFGDLREKLTGTGQVVLETALESVVVTDGRTSSRTSPTQLLRDAVRLVEATDLRRVYSLSLGLPDDRHDGLPTELSSYIDQLAFGRGSRKRLFCIAAGNVDPPGGLLVGDYIGTNDRTGIQTPGQAANALTVGAYTNLVSAPTGSRAHAKRGDLCPSSRTAMPWNVHLAHKPDIVMEGGNRIIEPDESATRIVEDLCVLTTHHEIPGRPFSGAAETSVAAAAAAGLATRISAFYPDLWPETVRGILVHSARWTPAMSARRSGATKAAAMDLIRRFGWGVPDEDGARRSSNSRLTMIRQDRISPFKTNANGAATFDKMRFYRLPWPRAALESIASQKARLRITLSYFADPHPLALSHENGRDYFSHGLSFDICEPDDDDDQAIARINQKHRSTGHKPGGKRGKSRWLLGSESRALGTLRQDVWEGKAGELARMNGISVFPQSGWWSTFKTGVQPEATVRYALIATIETPEAEIDLVTETEQALIAMSAATEIET